eukprot:scaffold308025_cov27-Tisochrysis_lutea.AAC.2
MVEAVEEGGPEPDNGVAVRRLRGRVLRAHQEVADGRVVLVLAAARSDETEPVRMLVGVQIRAERLQIPADRGLRWGWACQGGGAVGSGGGGG